jgi:hypothetical protein
MAINLIKDLDASPRSKETSAIKPALVTTSIKGKLRDFFYMLAKYVPSDIKYIFTKFYRHISTNNEANF